MDMVSIAVIAAVSAASSKALQRALLRRRTAREVMAVRLGALRREQAIADVVAETQRELVETFVRAQLTKRVGG